MIARMEGNQLHTFSRQSGMNAVFSGRELALLLAHAQTGGITPFIQRLFDLGVLPRDASARQEILRAVRMSEDGKTKAGLPKHRLPRSLHIEVTGLCPLTCPQCYQAKRRTGHMPFVLLEQLVDEASETGIFQIALGGGEPLIYPDLCRAVRRIAATGMGVSITSSGYGLTADTLSALADAGLNHLQISLNAVRQDVNRLSRAGHDEAMAALKLLSSRKLSFGINWTARKDTLPGLPELLAFAADLGADTVNILRYKPSPAETYATVAPNRVELATLAGLIAAHTGVPLTLDSAFANLRCLVQSGQHSCFQYGCGAGRDFLAVDARGVFTPCSHLNAGSATGGIGHYLGSRELSGFLAVTEDLEEPCAGCVFQKRCGGCRAVCLALTGRLNAGEADCPVHTPKHTAHRQ